MDLYQDAKVFNLDALPTDAIIVVTTEGQRQILSKDQLFKKLRASAARVRKPLPVAKKSKLEK